MAARLSLGVPLVGTQLRVSDDAFLLFYEKKKSTQHHVRIRLSKVWRETHKNAQMAPMTSAKKMKPKMIPTLPCDRKFERADRPCGSGSIKTNLRPGSSEELVVLSGLKQYWVKHCVQKSERARGGLVWYRARSMAAHCRHLPKFGSGEFVLGTKPLMTLAWT